MALIHSEMVCLLLMAEKGRTIFGTVLLITVALLQLALGSGNGLGRVLLETSRRMASLISV